MAGALVKQHTWPQIAKDFDNTPDYQKNVVFTQNYVGTKVDLVAYDLHDFGFVCTDKNFVMDCQYETDSLMDTIFWKIKIGYLPNRDISSINGYFHHVQ